ncbi:MAG: hypothetical protein M2R45_01102 [Verrucomicrobia subdivision 3 bacterium]|nr:hypothetical protein [Limisphaerales bacterium]MCS1414213.1 hypothetical protein [Limisphaerales bacterium]
MASTCRGFVAALLPVVQEAETERVAAMLQFRA